LNFIKRNAVISGIPFLPLPKRHPFSFTVGRAKNDKTLFVKDELSSKKGELFEGRVIFGVNFAKHLDKIKKL
jgi:hypothetical protein